MTVGELSERMTSEEFSGWIAHDRTHISEAWYMNAQLCFTLACCHAADPPRFEDFLPRRRVQMTEAQMKANLATAL